MLFEIRRNGCVNRPGSVTCDVPGITGLWLSNAPAGLWPKALMVSPDRVLWGGVRWLEARLAV